MEPDGTRIEIGTVRVKCPSVDEADCNNNKARGDSAEENGAEDGRAPLHAAALLPSQSQLHLPLRAKFGLLSNLLDLMSEPYNNNTNNYVPVHARRSPANIHALLSPSEDTYQKFNTEEEPLNKEPFDLELLEQCPGFVRRHLLNYHPLLHGGCAFMKRLTAMIDGRSDVDEGTVLIRKA